MRHVRLIAVQQVVTKPRGPSPAEVIFKAMAAIAVVVGFMAILPFLLLLMAGGLTLWGLIALIRAWVRLNRRAKAAAAEKGDVESVPFKADHRQIPVSIDSREDPKVDQPEPLVIPAEVTGRKAA